MTFVGSNRCSNVGEWVFLGVVIFPTLCSCNLLVGYKLSRNRLEYNGRQQFYPAIWRGNIVRLDVSSSIS